jgi:hypothetical protein
MKHDCSPNCTIRPLRYCVGPGCRSQSGRATAIYPIFYQMPSRCRSGTAFAIPRSEFVENSDYFVSWFSGQGLSTPQDNTTSLCYRQFSLTSPERSVAHSYEKSK